MAIGREADTGKIIDNEESTLCTHTIQLMLQVEHKYNDKDQYADDYKQGCITKDLFRR